MKASSMCARTLLDGWQLGWLVGWAVNRKGAANKSVMNRARVLVVKFENVMAEVCK